MRAHCAAQTFQGLIRRDRLPIRASRDQRVERVGGSENPPTHGNVVARNSMWIALTVPALVMIPYKDHGPLDVMQGRKNREANVDVLIHVLRLFGGQWTGLVQHAFTHADV